MSTPPKDQSKSQPKSLMRSLGEFFGHIAKGATTKVEPPKPVRQPHADGPSKSVHHEQVQGDEGQIILRRTTIEEIEVRPGGSHPDNPGKP